MITTVEQFKEIVEGDYGIKDLSAYDEYKKKMWERGVTVEELAKLSPDNIDSSSFWRYIEENPELAKDAISFGITKTQDIKDANLRNWGLSLDLSTVNYVIKYSGLEGCPLLDIGAGYGMLKEYVEKYTKLEYNGIDVYPKIPGVKQVENGSTIPADLMAKKYGLVIATNVFQHLSVKQRRHYYEQVAKILIPQWGMFSVSNMATIGKPAGFKGADGKSYCCHYGQYTEIQSVQELESDLLKHFTIISIMQRVYDQSFTFHCMVKPHPPTMMLAGDANE